MPALPPVPQVLKVEFEHTNGDAPIVNVLHFKYAGSQGDSINILTLAIDISNAWDANVVTALNADTVHTLTKLTDLTSDTSPVGEVADTTAGGSAGAALAAGSAAVVSHHISRRYRGGHPRTYLGAITQADMLDGQRLKPVFVSGMEGNWSSFIAAVNAISLPNWTPLTFVNVSYRSGGVRRVTPVVDNISGSAVQQRICSQRRRNGALFPE